MDRFQEFRSDGRRRQNRRYTEAYGDLSIVDEDDLGVWASYVSDIKQDKWHIRSHGFKANNDGKVGNIKVYVKG